MKARFVAFLSILPFLISCLAAQEAGMAVEPFFPPFCSTVDAQLKATGNTLAPADEQKVDTARIQRAIDRCGKGRAVKLRVNEEMNAFLSGPLVLKPQVALVLDRGVTLFASRDAALYDRTMGSCGVASDVTAGCKPLISVEKADGVAVMGDGTIDGRGGEKMLNGQSSWWDFAKGNGSARIPRLISADNSDHLTVYRVTLKNAPAEAVFFDHGDGLTVYGVHIVTPQQGARNTKPIVTGSGAKNVTITRSEGMGTDRAAQH